MARVTPPSPLFCPALAWQSDASAEGDEFSDFSFVNFAKLGKALFGRGGAPAAEEPPPEPERPEARAPLDAAAAEDLSMHLASFEAAEAAAAAAAAGGGRGEAGAAASGGPAPA